MMTPGDAYNQSHHLLHPIQEPGFYQLLIDVIEDHDHTVRPKEHR